MIDPERLQRAYTIAHDALLAERTPAGHWVGELSTSALSTATAIMALSLVDRTAHAERIKAGLAWLTEHQNTDGGWGDTVRSISNISTTMLGRAALHIAAATSTHASTLKRADAYMQERFGATPAEHAEAVRRRYGKDRTFSVPILTTCALAGLVDWREVPPLPFELACVPQSWYRFVRLPVVSYALPALIGIGQCVNHHRPPRNPLLRWLRRWAIAPSLRVLERIQPTNGGFLEATPLTSFVTLSLAASGRGEHPVTRRGVDFIVASMRPDGSWPIDTNLATWVTTLAINALATADDRATLDRQDTLRDWLLAQQYRQRHPYTGAEPGGWAWTDLPGGVPDCDDTPGALLALQHLDPPPLTEAMNAGRTWLRDLQNSDGGWPTFCRGWTGLPFDRSGSDLTAHALRALRTGDTASSQAERRGFDYLARQQRADGSWLPLWFGNQHATDDENPTYGTAKVLAAYRDLGREQSPECRRGVVYLLATQNADGGWGGAANTPSSVEETALAVEVLLDLAPGEAADRGVVWLMERVESGAWREATPIGFYFAKLWYFERLYPLVFTVAALGRARR